MLGTPRGGYFSAELHPDFGHTCTLLCRKMRPFHRPFLPQEPLSAHTKGHQNTDLPPLTIQPRRTCSNPPFTSTLPALNIQWHTNRQQSVVGKQTDQPKSECCSDHKKNTLLVLTADYLIEDPQFLVAIADLTHPLSNNRSSIRIIGCLLL